MRRFREMLRRLSELALAALLVMTSTGCVMPQRHGQARIGHCHAMPTMDATGHFPMPQPYCETTTATVRRELHSGLHYVPNPIPDPISTTGDQ